MRWKPCLAAALAVILATSDLLAAASRVAPGTRVLRSAPGAAAAVYAVPPELAFSGDLDAAVSQWTPPLLDAFEQASLAGRPSPPDSLIYRSDARLRFGNAVAAHRLKRPLFQAMPRILGEIRLHQGSGARTSLERVISGFQRIIEDHYSSEAIVDKRDREERKLSEQWDGMRAGVDLGAFEVEEALRATQDYQADFERVRGRFGDEASGVFSDEVRRGAAFCNLGSLVIILPPLGLKPASPDALTALTLLHPITDDALDRGVDVGPSMAKITRVLEGERVEPANAYEKVVFALIGDIFDGFSPAEHPMLQKILLALHRAQLESARLQRAGAAVDRAKLLELTARKGGLTALAVAYVSLGTLRFDEARFFYQTGLLFQLGDDLTDVAEDRRDGTTTLWMLAARSRPAYRATMQRFFSLQQFLENDSPGVLADHPQRAQLVNQLRFVFRFYLFASLMNPTLDGFNADALKHLLPLSPRNIRSVMFSLFKGVKEEALRLATPEESGSIDFLGKALDKHFLEEAFGRFERRTAGLPAAFSYRIRHVNPAFYAIKLYQGLESFVWWYLAAMWEGNAPRPTLKQHLMFYGLLFAYLLLPQAVHGEALRGLAGAVAVGGVLMFWLGSPDGPGPRIRHKDIRARIIYPSWALLINLILAVYTYLRP